ncbi:MAG TPA: NAD-dependent epimerase/dehydratase family protein [Bryobacteraceae bacterium]|jgi:UDP-glucose 4-epimerase|nr:NAD-dependent epimerase/dehydratase family protein [Bryobacteraceae bacterium]
MPINTESVSGTDLAAGLARYRRALITGGAGLVGSHIADLLARVPSMEEIVVFDDFSRGRRENLTEALRSGKVHILEGDIADPVDVEHAIEGIDLVFHQAAIRITHCAKDPRLALDVLAGGTFNVLEAAVAMGVKKIVAASSASVYGMAEAFPTPETHHGYANRTLYGAAKLFNEGMLRSFHDMHGVEYVALRYFNVYGPRMDTYGAYTEVMIRWMERLAEGKPCLILGDGKQTMDFVYIEDVARANLLAAASPASDEVINIASGTETNLNELARAMGRAMGVALEPEYGPARKVNPVERRLADVRKAERLLGFRAEVPLEEGLIRLVAWWKEQQAAVGVAALA